jgi:hypothetical protein
MLVLTLLLACDPPRQTQGCTAMAAVSVSVDVTTEDGATPTGLAGTWSVDGVEMGACDALLDGVLLCGYEREGHIEVTVTADGYEPWTGAADVAADECHVIGETLDAVLAPAPTECGDAEFPAAAVTLAGRDGEALEDPWVTWELTDSDAPAAACDLEGDYWACGWGVSGEVVVRGGAAGHTEDSETVTVARTENGCYPVTEDVALVVEWGAD